MTRTARALAGGLMLLLSAAASARAERFAGVKYVGGLAQHGRRQVGALVLENGELRFEDKQGRLVFIVPLAEAKAWIGAEQRTTVASIFRSSALMMVAIPLSVGQIDPMQAWSRDGKPVLVVQLGPRSGSATLRWRGPAGLEGIAQAINRAASGAAPGPTAD